MWWSVQSSDLLGLGEAGFDGAATSIWGVSDVSTLCRFLQPFKELALGPGSSYIPIYPEKGLNLHQMGISCWRQHALEDARNHQQSHLCGKLGMGCFLDDWHSVENGRALLQICQWCKPTRDDPYPHMRTDMYIYIYTHTYTVRWHIDSNQKAFQENEVRSRAIRNKPGPVEGLAAFHILLNRFLRLFWRRSFSKVSCSFFILGPKASPFAFAKEPHTAKPSKLCSLCTGFVAASVNKGNTWKAWNAATCYWFLAAHWKNWKVIGDHRPKDGWISASINQN